MPGDRDAKVAADAERACSEQDRSELDRSELERWWQAFVATGTVPSELQHVQGRLIRAVHRGELPSGPVHVKTMTFPRGKDRLRYAFRALPAVHEARMLEATRRAGIPCPEVVAVRAQRRAGMPFRSMLVLRSLPLAEDPGGQSRLADEIALTARLLDAGIHHRDLHTDNFVRQHDGQLAILDLQSASRIRPGQNDSRSLRESVSARLLRDRSDDERAFALVRMREVGLLRSDEESDSVDTRIREMQARFRDARIRRCLMTSTEFERRVGIRGVEYRQRGALPAGRWWWGDRSLRAAWVGQRARHLAEGSRPLFAAFFQKWWWLGGGAGLYVPEQCNDERIEVEVRSASSAATPSVR